MKRDAVPGMSINGESPTKSKQLELVLPWPASGGNPDTSSSLLDTPEFNHPVFLV